MRDKLTHRERNAEECPDCGGLEHQNDCRRLAMGMPLGRGGANRPDIQAGPPWNDWPEGLEPVNPRAKR